MTIRYDSIRTLLAAAGLLMLSSATAVANPPEPLLLPVGVPETTALPNHVVAAQPVVVNRRALQSPVLSIELFGDTVIAVRETEQRGPGGDRVWSGHVQGQPLDSVIVSVRGNHFSALIEDGERSYKLGIGADGQNRLFELMLEALPPDDAGALPDGSPEDGGVAMTAEPAPDNVVQDLLVVYTQGACNSAGGCGQLEADIATAVADINAAYVASGIAITMNLAGTALTDYALTDASNALSHLRGTSDGYMDEVHPLRDSLGADIVSLIYDGQGCGIGYLGSSDSSAFNVTAEPCLVGNRTMAHEIGHNQGAHHDRVTVGTTSTTTYNYGFRRCNNTALADYDVAPHFRTIMSYSCTNAARKGIFSSPDYFYSGVPQGIDPDVDPARGAFNARTLNERASYVAGFRTAPSSQPPAPPDNLWATATGPDAIGLSWRDNSADESAFVVQRSLDQGVSWSTVATLAANTTAYSDLGLVAETTYHYRVRAENSAGSSAYAGPVWATTDSLPDRIDDLALADVGGRGSVTGSFEATHAEGGAYQTITEQHSGGPRRSRRQSYEHAWDFDVNGGAGGVVATVAAWVSGNEGANFYWSDDGGASRNPMFSVTNAEPGSPQTFLLPGHVSGPLRIGVSDAEQSSGEAVDSVFVDYLVISSFTQAGDPPAAPGDLALTGVTSSSVSLAFTDHADNEWGFDVWRADSDPGSSCSAGAVVDTLGASDGTGGLVSYTDGSVSAARLYWYWITAFNGGGDSGCSTAVAATTSAAPPLSLDSVTPYKVKGRQKVDLAWTAAGAVDVYRDDALVAPAVDGGFYTDSIDAKGGGSYSYRVCEAGGNVCSEVMTAAF